MGDAAELIMQHEVLRVLTIDLVQVARTIMTDGTGTLVSAAGRLAAALAEHQRLEDGVLAPMLLAGDRWSALRVSEMLAVHRQEHDDFLAALRLVSQHDEPSIDLEARVFELAAGIYRHMDREEVEYLNTRVLDAG